jgi:hypothetical protein
VRPCECDDFVAGPYQKGQCWKCWSYHNDPVVRAFWDGRKPPGPVRMALNFTQAVRDHIAAGLPVVDERVYRARIDVCRSCPLRSEEGKCNLCGCPVTDKAWWGEQACPSCKTCGRPEGEHPAEGCEGFESKWAAADAAAKKGGCACRR